MEKDTIEITNEVLRIGSEIYQIKNLVRIGKSEKKPENGGLSFLLFLTIIGTIYLFSQKSDIFGCGVIAAFILIGVISSRRSNFAISLETNSGSGEILWSKNEKDIDSLIELISIAMVTKDKMVKYTINMNDYSVRDVIMGDKFKNIKDAVIATHGSVSQRR